LPDDFSAVERLILDQLQDQRSRLTEIEERLRHIENGISILKAKAATIGAIAGAIPAALVLWMQRG